MLLTMYPFLFLFKVFYLVFLLSAATLLIDSVFNMIICLQGSPPPTCPSVLESIFSSIFEPSEAHCDTADHDIAGMSDMQFVVILG